MKALPILTDRTVEKDCISEYKIKLRNDTHVPINYLLFTDDTFVFYN